MATALGHRTGDTRLIAWSCGASVMTARARGDHAAALDHAAQGLARADDHLGRAQVLAWATAPTMAHLGRADEAEHALADASRALDADPVGSAPGRFGFDPAEYRLHAAETHLILGHSRRAAEHAIASLDACLPETPGWAAASAVLAQTDAGADPADAAQRALDILDRIPAARLRATTRDRLTALNHALAGVDTTHVTDLRDRLRALPPPVNPDGHATA